MAYTVALNFQWPTTPSRRVPHCSKGHLLLIGVAFASRVIDCDRGDETSYSGRARYACSGCGRHAVFHWQGESRKWTPAEQVCAT